MQSLLLSILTRFQRPLWLVLGAMLFSTGFLNAVNWQWTWTPTASEASATAVVCPLQYDKKWAYTVELDDGDLVTANFGPKLFSNFTYTEAPPGVAGGKAHPVVGSLAVFCFRTSANTAYTSFGDLRSSKSNGWGLENHSYFHAGKTYAPVEILSTAQIRDSIFWNQLLFAEEVGGGRAPTHFVFPNGYQAYGSNMAEFGMVSASLFGGKGYNLFKAGVDLKSINRTYLDESYWVANGKSDPLFLLPPGGPIAGDIIIDFTHALNPSTSSLNYQRWQQRLSNFIVPRGAGGSDEFWSAPTEQIVNYTVAAKKAVVNLSPGKLDVQIPDNIPGSAITVKITGIPDATPISAPPGGCLYRSPGVVWLTTPVLGLPGTASPNSNLHRVYQGPASSQIVLSKPTLLGGVRVKENGSLATNFSLKIDLVLADDTVSNFAMTNQSPGFVAGYQLFPMLPNYAPVVVKAVRFTLDNFMKEVEIWGIDTTNAADTTAPVINGFPASFTTNAAFSIAASVDENFGYVSTNGPGGPYFSFSVSGTNVAIAQTTTLWYFGRDVLGNTSATNSRTYTVNLPPAPPVVSVSPGTLTTNLSFTASLGVDKNFGYWSTNGLSGPYFSYSVSGTNVTINQTTTLWYYGSSNGLTSATNTVTYTFDTSAPTVSGIPASLTTNAPFTIYVGVNENFGYWSTNSSSGPYFSFSVSGTNVAIAQTTTLWYFGRDVLGNTSATNSRTYTVNLPPAPPAVSVSPGTLTTNLSFTASLGVDKNFGYWSTNGFAGPYFAFPISGTNLTISKTTTLWYFGSTNSLTSATNTVTYTFDTSAPTVSGIPASLTTNAPFTINAGVNENFGYWSTNSSSGPYFSFSVSGTNVAIAQTTTLWYFGRDVLGNTSATNQSTFTFTPPLSTTLGEAVAIGSPYDGRGPGITFARLTAQAAIKIYSVSGKFVAEVKSNPASATGTLLWTVRQVNGERAPAGTYVCVLTDPAADRKILKVVVLP